MKTKKILQPLAIYIVMFGVFMLLSSPTQENVLFAIITSGIVLLFNIISIFRTKLITKSIEVDKENDRFTGNPFTKVFQSTSQQLGLIIFVFLSIAVIIWTWKEDSSFSTKIVVSLIYGVITLIIILTLLRQKLVFSERGVIYFDEFGKVESPWKNVASIIKLGFGTNSLIVRDVTYSGLWKGTIYEYEIPLSIFDKKWRTGEIGKIIQQNAHLEFIDK